jgi:hypothetical protein
MDCSGACGCSASLRTSGSIQAAAALSLVGVIAKMEVDRAFLSKHSRIDRQTTAIKALLAP